MFTRIVELTTKPGKHKQLSDTINDKILPILKKQKGFVDEAVLISDKEDNRVLSLSFWNTKENAEEYHRAEYQKVHEMETLWRPRTWKHSERRTLLLRKLMLGELIRLIRSPMVGAKRKSASGSFAGGDSVGGRGVDLEGANHGFGLQEVPDHESTCTTQRLRGIFVES